MAIVPPPQGMNEVDYEAIEAAVTETVRGRWFLAEFARRNRIAETRQLLDAMARIETAVAAGQVALPSVAPSIRLLVQRIKEIAAQLDTVASDMREAGVEEEFAAAVDLQARAVAGMMRSATPTKEALQSRTPDAPPPPQQPNAVSAQMPRMPRAELPAALAPAKLEDPRLATLSGLDGMTLAKKLAVFS